MEDRLKRIFEDELDEEMYSAIRYFLTSYEIREGKFEGNQILLNKINRETVIIYQEYELQNGRVEYSREASIWDINKLILLLDKWMCEKKTV